MVTDQVLEELLGKIPQSLYRYSSLTDKRHEWMRELVVGSRLFFARPSSLNDPHDCRIEPDFNASALAIEAHWRKHEREMGLKGPAVKKRRKTLIRESRTPTGQRRLAELAILTIRSRRLNNLTKTYPSVVAAVSTIKAESALIDGEIVALDAGGRPSFQALQNARKANVAFFAFDLLELNGRDLTPLPLKERRSQLGKLVNDTQVLYSGDLPGTAAQIEQAVRDLGLEGVVAKRRGSKYVPGVRSAHWIKVRFNRRQEFVVGGYRPIDHDFDALLVGYYDGRRLLFAAKVRAGFRPATRADIFKRVGPPIERCPFADLPREGRGRFSEGISAEDMAELRWVKPRVVVEVAFVEWTDSGLLRHPTYVGVREDKRAGEVPRL